MPEHFMGKQLFDKHKHNVIENENPNLKDQLNIFWDFYHLPDMLVCMDSFYQSLQVAQYFSTSHTCPCSEYAP